MNRKQRRMETRRNKAPPPKAETAVQTLFADAIRLHQAGRPGEAEQLYHQVLAIDPHHAGSLHLLGVFAYQTGQPAIAATMIGKAIAENASVALYHSDMGMAVAAQGKADEAVRHYRDALRVQRHFPAALKRQS